MVPLILLVGSAYCGVVIGGLLWLRWRKRRHQQRRSVELRRRFEECYDQMVLTLGRDEAEHDLARSLERFEREMARLVP